MPTTEHTAAASTYSPFASVRVDTMQSTSFSHHVKIEHQTSMNQRGIPCPLQRPLTAEEVHEDKMRSLQLQKEADFQLAKDLLGGTRIREHAQLVCVILWLNSTHAYMQTQDER